MVHISGNTNLGGSEWAEISSVAPTKMGKCIAICLIVKTNHNHRTTTILS